MSKLNKKQKTRRLAESAVMIAAATVLSLLPVIPLPFGGSVTLMSQVPVIIIGYRYGNSWGIKTGFVFSVLQLIFGLENFTYVNGIKAFAVLAFCDYFIAFSCLGLGGMFKNAIKNQTAAVALGAVTVSVIRFLCHFISGVTVWSEYAGDSPVWKYSLVYNGSFMLPEMLITAVGAVIIVSVFDLTNENITVKRKTRDV